MFTGTNVIDDARALLHDPNATTYTAADLVRWLNDELRTLRSDYPEAFMDSDGTTVALVEFTTASVGNSVGLPDHYRGVLVDSVVSRAHLMDAGDKEDREWSKHMDALKRARTARRSPV